MKNNTAIILLLLSVGLFYAFTNGQYQDVKKLYALASEYRDILQNVSDIVELRDRLLVTYETFPKAEIERISKVLPDNIDTVQLALDLDSMASRYGISIKSIKTETGVAQDTDLIVLPEYAGVYEKATVSLSFISSYENFKLLLADIEKSLRIMNIKSVSFRASDTGLYDYEISAETYWLK
ncbi:MAG: type 4a pilus biogenesis protein PilO [bacterium]|nr:type 4a pilus biogenesis protein PilO [bacterium]